MAPMPPQTINLVDDTSSDNQESFEIHNQCINLNTTHKQYDKNFQKSKNTNHYKTPSSSQQHLSKTNKQTTKSKYGTGSFVLNTGNKGKFNEI